MSKSLFLGLALFTCTLRAAAAQLPTPVLVSPLEVVEDDDTAYSLTFRLDSPGTVPVLVSASFSGSWPLPEFVPGDPRQACVLSPGSTCDIKFKIPDDHYPHFTRRFNLTYSITERFSDAPVDRSTHHETLVVWDRVDAAHGQTTLTPETQFALVGDVVHLQVQLPQPFDAHYDVESSDIRVATLSPPIVQPHPNDSTTFFNMFAAAPGHASITVRWQDKPYQPATAEIIVFDSTVTFGSDAHLRVPVGGHLDVPLVMTPPPPALVLLPVDDTTANGIVVADRNVSVDVDGHASVGIDAKATGTANVEVRTPGGRLAGAVTVDVVPFLELTDLAPDRGPAAGGTNVMLTGHGFVEPCAVTFDGIPAAQLTVNSATSISVLTPAHSAGSSDLSITCNGERAEREAAFTFASPGRGRAVRH